MRIGMMGAIVGDIAGSQVVWNNHKSKAFAFLDPNCMFRTIL